MWDGTIKKLTGTSRKNQTRRRAEAEQLRQDEIRLRGGPHPWEGERNTSIDDAFKRYIDWGKAEGGRNGFPWAPSHASMVEKQLPLWKERLGLKRLGDVVNIREAVERERAMMRKTLTAKGVNNYTDVLRGFLTYCTKRRMIESNPLAGMPGLAHEATQTPRRAMTAAELGQLLRSAPLERSLLYGVAAMTGLRRGEIERLDRDALDVERCGIVLRASQTKSRKEVFQPLPRDLVQQLQILATLPDRLYYRWGVRRDVPERPLLWVPSHTARFFYIDLEAAGIERETPDGRLDFHSLRVTYDNLLFEAGASVKEAQHLMRHADPRLTVHVYGRTSEQRRQELVESINGAIRTRMVPAQAGARMAAGAENADPVRESARSDMVRALGIEPRTYGLKGRCSTS